MNNSTENVYEHNKEMWSLILYEEFKNESLWFKVLYIGLLGTLFVIGLTGNLLICTVIFYDKKMHTTTNIYILNMAISDTLVSFGIIQIICIYVKKSFHFGITTCKIQFLLFESLWNNSILVMTILAVERYLAIWHPLKLSSKAPWKRAIKGIVIIWIIAICETLPELLTVDVIITDSFTTCSVIPSSSARIVNGILAVVTFIIPLLIMLFVYTMIAFKVNKTEKLISNRKIFNHKDNRGKVNRLTVTLTLSFLVCWLPFFAYRSLFIFCDITKLLQSKKLISICSRIVMINSWFSIALNPILFSLMSTKFRRSLKILWTTKIKKQQHSHINTIL